MPGWIWVQTVCKGYQQTTKVGKELNTKKLVDTTFWLKPSLKLISFGYNFFHLAKVLATTNSEPGLALSPSVSCIIFVCVSYQVEIKYVKTMGKLRYKVSRQTIYRPLVKSV